MSISVIINRILCVGDVPSPTDVDLSRYGRPKVTPTIYHLILFIIYDYP